ncbi:MAG: regulatory signaling modulator protein AmpE [Candidatus Thiodiazotropha sp. (ex Epidulcina cf. delphinae)]|nr:regulatory signaling modulator protein AmpE [Candidatus Thiodiazotropha sp. (ex Epidulcina cf. delphinae)]
MTLTIILICLIAERFLLDHRHLRNNRWFFRYDQWQQRQGLPDAMQRGLAGMLLLLLPPLLLTGIFQHLFHDALFGLLDIGFSIAVLLYCLGPDDLDSQVSHYTQAFEHSDDAKTKAIARSLIDDEPPPSEPARSQAVAEGVLFQANRRLFAVLFWFILLGPVGAMFYRLATWLSAVDQAERDVDFSLNCKQLITILEWIPARITASFYAVAGSFEDALYGWRSYRQSRYSEFSDSNAGTLICTGSGAMRMTTLLEEANDGAQVYSYLPQAAMALIWRSLVVCLVLIALLTLTGLI